GYVTTADTDSNTTIDYYSQGPLAAESRWTGGTPMASEDDYVPAQSGTGPSAGTQLDLSKADGDGNITADTYDGAGNVLTSTEPDGIGAQLATTTQQPTTLGDVQCSSTQQASSTCQQSAGPPLVTPGGVITPPAAVPPQGIIWTLYDTSGNALYSTTGVYEPGSSTAAYAQTSYTLYKGNSVTLNGSNITCNATPPAPALPCATIDAKGVVTQLGYDAQGDLTSSSVPDG